MDSAPNRIAEEREDQMVSPVPGERCGKAILRPAHFLTPMVPSGKFPMPDFPSKTYFKFYENGPNSSNLKVHFTGWKYPTKDWKAWTDRMHSLHHSIWKKAGISEAILSSLCTVHRCDDLIYGFVEKWCPGTNTFVFPWGEATVTLEDVGMIGGYSVVGGPVFSSLECPELKEVELKLLSVRSELCRTKTKKACQGQWLRKFMDSGMEIEHEAFLAMWLSRFVFPTKTRDRIIGKHVLPLAILMARGNKIALAPAVLAGIYSNLSDMKNAFVHGGVMEVSVSAPFQLLQIWIWERFPSLRPNPVFCRHDQDEVQARFSRWDDLRFKGVVDVGSAIDESADCFLWRPYVIGHQRSFLYTYRDGERLVSVGSEIDEEMETLVRCLRFSELVGIDPGSNEQYLSHRVSMQFGYDQDVPGPVERSNCAQIVAWENYTRKVEDQKLYIPPRLFESDVTHGYAEWWKKNMPASSNNPKKRRLLVGKCKSSKKMRLQSDVSKGKRDKKKVGSTGSLHKKHIANHLDSKRAPPEKISKDEVSVPPSPHPEPSENNDDRFQDRVDSENGIGNESDDDVSRDSPPKQHERPDAEVSMEPVKIDSSRGYETVLELECEVESETPGAFDADNGGLTYRSEYGTPGAFDDDVPRDFPPKQHERPNAEANMEPVKIDSTHGYKTVLELECEVESETPDAFDADKGGSTRRKEHLTSAPSEVQLQRGNSVALMETGDQAVASSSRNNSNLKTGSGNGSRRLYSIEEVEAMIAKLEKIWTKVKAMRRASAARK